MMVKRLFLPRRNKLVRIGVAILLVVLDFGLTRTSYRRISKLLITLSPSPDLSRRDMKRATQVARLVNTVARHPTIQASCLRRTLLTWWILRWLRLPSEVRIGINGAGGHAWLEHHGIVINDRFDVLTQYPIIYTDELTPEKMAKLI